jgi:hypothetical protein
MWIVENAGYANFGEPHTCEVSRIYLLGGSANKGKRRARLRHLSPSATFGQLQ